MPRDLARQRPAEPVAGDRRRSRSAPPLMPEPAQRPALPRDRRAAAAHRAARLHADIARRRRSRPPTCRRRPGRSAPSRPRCGCRCASPGAAGKTSPTVSARRASSAARSRSISAARLAGEPIAARAATGRSRCGGALAQRERPARSRQQLPEMDSDAARACRRSCRRRRAPRRRFGAELAERREPGAHRGARRPAAVRPSMTISSTEPTSGVSALSTRALQRRAIGVVGRGGAAPCISSRPSSRSARCRRETA